MRLLKDNLLIPYHDLTQHCTKSGFKDGGLGHDKL